MASYTCKIRVHLPLTSGLKPDTGNSGHYDIQIMHPELRLFGKNYKNPIISYGGIDGHGKVEIKNGADATVSSNCLYCHAPFTVTDLGIDNFVNGWLNTYCEKAASGSIHDVTEGNYASYSEAKYNCFGAVGEWCALMGDSFLKSIHDSKNYKDYYAWAMYKQYHTAWIYDALNS